MCGLYGAAGPHIDPDVIGQMAQLAGRRGPHGWGAAVIAPDGRLQVHERRRGGVDPAAIARLVRETCPPAAAVIGHCRLATTGGDLADTDSYQPLIAGEFVVAHNGTVRNYAALLHAHDMTPRTTTDSEVIAILADSYAPDEAQPVWWAMQQVSHDAPHAVIAYGDDRLWAVRLSAGRLPGHPLYLRRDDDTTYVCSWQPGPEWSLLPDDAFYAWETPCRSTS